MRLFAPARALLVALAVALSGSVIAQAADRPVALDLGDGYQVRLIGAGDTLARVGHPKTITISVAVLDDKIHADHKKLIEAADRVFESALLNSAEQGYYRRALVNILRPGQSSFEDFLYLRGEDDVWLRQAGAQPWKTAQDRKAWTPPKSEKMQVPSFGAFAVETAIEVAPPDGFKRAAEIDFVTPTPVFNTQRKYQEIKALWEQMDRARLKSEGFDIVMIGNFTTAQKGRFHARKGFFVRIPREIGADWPELPASAPDNKDVLISQNEVGAQQLAMAIAETFAKGGSLAAPGSAIDARAAQTELAHASPSLSTYGMGAGRAYLNFDPSAAGRNLMGVGVNNAAVFMIDPATVMRDRN